MRLEQTHRRRVRLALTPLIDVVFLLLLFFMLSSTFLDLQQLRVGAQAVSRPSAGKGEALVVRVETTSLRVGHQAVTPGGLVAALNRLAGGDKGRKVLVRPGEGVRLQRLVDVLEAIGGGGFTDIALQESR